MVFRICETCLIPSDSVELRSSDQNLCDSCEEKRRRTAKIKAKNASVLNAKAQPFLPKRLHRRSRSAGAILPEQVWASPPLASNYNNSEGGKKDKPEAESANKQTRTKQHVIKHGTHQEDEGAGPAAASILDNSLAKWSTTAKSPTLKRLQELCREKNIKTTGRKKELKARLEEHQTKGRANASQARPGPSGNTDAEEHATPPKLAEALVRGKKSPLIVKLPRSTSFTVPKSVTYMIEDEDTDDYEADISDDEVEGDRLTTKSESPRPSKIQQQGNGVMEQNTNYFDKVLKLLISERIKTTKLTAKIEQLQMQNDSRKASFFPQEDDIPTLQTPGRSISAEIPVPLFVETPEIHVNQERENEKLHKEITALKKELNTDKEEKLREQNEKLKHELVELKALVKTKKIQEELQSENEKLHKEITALKKELNADKTDKVKEQQKEHSNKKQDIIVAGDSMLNNIEDRFNLNTKNANVSIRAFPGSTIEDFQDYVAPLARKKPDALIVHIGTNNVRSDTPKQVTEKLIQLHRHVKSIAPETKLVLSNIIRRHDYQNLGKKIIEINSLLAIECKRNKIDLIDNINVTGIGRKGLHPNNLGKEQIAGNLLGYIMERI